MYVVSGESVMEVIRDSEVTEQGTENTVQVRWGTV